MCMCVYACFCVCAIYAREQNLKLLMCFTDQAYKVSRLYVHVYVYVLSALYACERKGYMHVYVYVCELGEVYVCI
jgi:hypothetical protein